MGHKALATSMHCMWSYLAWVWKSKCTVNVNESYKNIGLKTDTYFDNLLEMHQCTGQ